MLNHPYHLTQFVTNFEDEIGANVTVNEALLTLSMSAAAKTRLPRTFYTA